MEYVVIDGASVSRVSAHSKTQAASFYAERHLPRESKSKLFRLKVLSLDEATKVECQVTRSVDESIETIAMEAA